MHTTTRNQHWSAKRIVIFVFCLTCGFFTFFGNFWKLTTYQKNYQWLRYVYAPLGFWQGWNMYSSNLDEVSPIRFRYDFADGSRLYDQSDYGFRPSFTRTLRGNMDVLISYDRSGHIAQPVLDFYCQNPKVGERPVRVALEEQTSTVQNPYTPETRATTLSFLQLREEECND